jgi:hypothetical protein
MKWLRLSSPVALLMLAGTVVFVSLQREPLQAESRRPNAWEYKVLVAGIDTPTDTS